MPEGTIKYSAFEIELIVKEIPVLLEWLDNKLGLLIHSKNQIFNKTSRLFVVYGPQHPHTLAFISRNTDDDRSVLYGAQELHKQIEHYRGRLGSIIPIHYTAFMRMRNHFQCNRHTEFWPVHLVN